MKRKKYNPQKEINKITKSVVSVGVGTHVAYGVADVAGHGTAARITPAMKMTTVIPTAQAGSSIIGAVGMLGKKPRRKKRKR